MYDVTNKSTFDCVPWWLDTLRQTLSNIPIILGEYITHFKRIQSAPKYLVQILCVCPSAHDHDVLLLRRKLCPDHSVLQ